MTSNADFSLSLPDLGGIAIINPAEISNDTYLASIKITDPLKDSLMTGEKEFSYEVYHAQSSAKREMSNNRRAEASKTANNQGVTWSSSKICRIGPRNRCTQLPPEFGFTLHKGAFTDALALRYDWPLNRTPTNCECGLSFSVDHSRSCPRGGFTILRHNEVRDLTANLLTEVSHEVSTEPDLQPVTTESFNLRSTNTQDNARLNITMNGFWGG